MLCVSPRGGFSNCDFYHRLLWLRLAAVALVLLVAGANLTNLQMACRAWERGLLRHPSSSVVVTAGRVAGRDQLPVVQDDCAPCARAAAPLGLRRRCSHVENHRPQAFQLEHRSSNHH